MDRERFLPLCGVAVVVLVVFALVVLGGDTPGNGAPGAVVASYYDAHQARELTAAFLLAAAAPLLVIFGASVGALSRAEANRRPVWELVLLAGCVLTAGGFLLAALFTFALADTPGKLGADALQALNVLDNDAWVVLNGGLGVMMLGAAGSSLARSLLPRWLGWTALVLGVALFVPFADFVALLLSGVWIILTSVTLVRLTGGTDLAAAPGVAS